MEAESDALPEMLQGLEKRIIAASTQQFQQIAVIAPRIAELEHLRAALGMNSDDPRPAAEELNRLLTEIDTLQKTHAELTASTSWKVTAPLRAIKRILTRGTAAPK